MSEKKDDGLTIRKAVAWSILIFALTIAWIGFAYGCLLGL